MYNVLNVSNFIINYGNEKGYDITLEKLSKLLYFTQAAFLKVYDEPAFDDRIYVDLFYVRIWEVLEKWKKVGYGKVLRDNGRYLMADDHKVLIRMVVDALGGYDDKVLWKVIKKGKDLNYNYEATPLLLKERFGDGFFIKVDDILWMDKKREMGVKKERVIDYWSKSNCGRAVKNRVILSEERVWKGVVYKKVAAGDIIKYFGESLRELEDKDFIKWEGGEIKK